MDKEARQLIAISIEILSKFIDDIIKRRNDLIADANDRLYKEGIDTTGALFHQLINIMSNIDTCNDIIAALEKTINKMFQILDPKDNINATK